MDFTLIKSMLYNLVKTYGGVEAIWADQSEMRPPRPYASMKIITGPKRIGNDDEFRQPSSGEFQLTGMRNFTLSVQFFGSEALEAAAKLLSGIELTAARELMQTRNVGYVNCSGITNLTAMLENRWEQRYALDLFLTCTDEITDSVTYVESVEIENQITGDIQVIN